MLVALAVLLALSCIAASAFRLWLVAAPTAFEPDDVIRALDRGVTVDALRELAEQEPSAEWERELFAALAVEDPEPRAALVNEQLGELDLRMKRWERVPAVCARIATSGGLILGTMVLRRGLAEADAVGDLGEAFMRSVMNDALSVASLGIVGTAFCLGTHTHARRLTRARLESADRMVERLEAASG